MWRAFRAHGHNGGVQCTWLSCLLTVEQCVVQPVAIVFNVHERYRLPDANLKRCDHHPNTAHEEGDEREREENEKQASHHARLP